MLFLLQIRRLPAAAPNSLSPSPAVVSVPAVHISRIAKRSYKRALARQQRTGHAWYKGRLLPQPKLPPAHAPTSNLGPHADPPLPAYPNLPVSTCSVGTVGGCQRSALNPCCSG